MARKLNLRLSTAFSVKETQSQALHRSPFHYHATWAACDVRLRADMQLSLDGDEDVVVGNADFHRLHQRALTDRSHVGTLAD